MSAKAKVELELDPTSTGLTIRLDVTDQVLDWLLEHGEPETIAEQLWAKHEVRSWLIGLIAGDYTTQISSDLHSCDYSAREDFLAKVGKRQHGDRLRHAVHKLAEREAYTEAYWRLYHSLPVEYQRREPESLRFMGSSWEESKASWREELLKRLGLNAGVAGEP